jgi:hypothetical protein
MAEVGEIQQGGRGPVVGDEGHEVEARGSAREVRQSAWAMVSSQVKSRAKRVGGV